VRRTSYNEPPFYFYQIKLKEEEKVKRTRNLIWTLVSVLLVFSMLLTACGGEEATNTPKPEATEAPEPTAVQKSRKSFWSA